MLFNQMFDERFNELARKPAAKFRAAGAGGGPLTPDVATFQLSARVREGGLAEGLAALRVEARRVRGYGLSVGGRRGSPRSASKRDAAGNTALPKASWRAPSRTCCRDSRAPTTSATKRRVP